MAAVSPRIDRADVRHTADEHTLILAAGGVHVLLIRLRLADRVDELVNGAGTVVTDAVNAWALTGHDLSFELAAGAATALGVPNDLRLRLDVDDAAVRRVRAALPDILQGACFVVDTPEGRVAG